MECMLYYCGIYFALFIVIWTYIATIFTCLLLLYELVDSLIVAIQLIIALTLILTCFDCMHANNLPNNDIDTMQLNLRTRLRNEQNAKLAPNAVKNTILGCHRAPVIRN